MGEYKVSEAPSVRLGVHVYVSVATGSALTHAFTSNEPPRTYLFPPTLDGPQKLTCINFYSI